MTRLVALALLCLSMLAYAGVAGAATKPPYLLPSALEADLQENGLSISGRAHKVLDVGCVGVGYPGPKKADAVGLRVIPTFHIFECYLTVKGVPAVDMLRVQTRWNSHGRAALTFDVL